jgi:tetratricopeptide (TPR) repeat protein
VGQYYLKAADYQAAIDRFKEAIGYQSNLPLPWDLLGQACEKEHEGEEALAAYQKYLSMVPDGKESDRVRKRVAKLQADTAHDAGKKAEK